MSIGGLIRKVVGEKEHDEVVEGVIVDGPKQIEVPNAVGETVAFHLDSRPDVEFRLVLGPLTPLRKRGERVKVHFRGQEGKIVNAIYVDGQG